MLWTVSIEPTHPDPVIARHFGGTTIWRGDRKAEALDLVHTWGGTIGREAYYHSRRDWAIGTVPRFAAVCRGLPVDNGG
jgi:hypothetical protein